MGDPLLDQKVVQKWVPVLETPKSPNLQLFESLDQKWPKNRLFSRFLRFLAKNTLFSLFLWYLGIRRLCQDHYLTKTGQKWPKTGQKGGPKRGPILGPPKTTIYEFRGWFYTIWLKKEVQKWVSFWPKPLKRVKKPIFDHFFFATFRKLNILNAKESNLTSLKTWFGVFTFLGKLGSPKRVKMTIFTANFSKNGSFFEIKMRPLFSGFAKTWKFCFKNPV